MLDNIHSPWGRTVSTLEGLIMNLSRLFPFLAAFITVVSGIAISAETIPRVAVMSVDNDSARVQYDWLIYGARWVGNQWPSMPGVIRLTAPGTAGEWDKVLAESDVLLCTDTALNGKSSAVAEKNAAVDWEIVIPRLKAFLEKGGMVLVPGAADGELARHLFPGEKTFKATRPSYAIPNADIELARYDRQSPVLSYPQLVPGVIWKPEWSPHYKESWGWSDVPEHWNKLAWNMYDQPVLMERTVGKGLLLLMALPIWEHNLYHYSEWAPLLCNAWELTSAQRRGEIRPQDIFRGRLGRMTTDSGALRIKGKPFLPISACHVGSGQYQRKGAEWFQKLSTEKQATTFYPVEKEIREVADAGFNMYEFTVDVMPEPEIKAMLDLSSSLNLTAVPMVWGLDWKRLDSLRQHPAVGMWNSTDEPELGHAEDWQVINRYQQILKFDDTRPVFMNMAMPGYNYRLGGDVLGSDGYPVPVVAPTESGHRTDFWYRMVANDWPLLAYVQNIDLYSIRYPTLEEYRFMVYDNITQGARGYIAFAYMPDAPGKDGKIYPSQYKPIWDATKQVNGELRDLTPLLTGHRIMGARLLDYVSVSPPGNWNHSVLFTDGTNWCLIIANASAEPVKKLRVSLNQEITNPHRVTVKDGTERSRKLNVKSGIFEDRPLESWGVRIYIW